MKKLKSALSSLALSISIAAFTSGCGSTSVSDEETSADNAQNGAFINIEATTSAPEIVTDKAEQIKPERKLSTMEITDKSSCYHKTLNSVDYFNYANGTIETNMVNGDVFTIEYNVDMTNKKSYQRTKASDFDEEVFAADGYAVTIDNRQEIAKTSANSNITVPAYDEANDPAVNKNSREYASLNDDSQRIVNVSSDIKEYRYRQNPTNLQYASTFSLFPQEMIFGFLSNKDLWEIKGTDEYLGREVTVITGTTEPDYGSKLNVDSFMMYFDNKTGIMLSFEGYDAAGNLTNYSRTTEFSDEKDVIPLLD